MPRFGECILRCMVLTAFCILGAAIGEEAWRPAHDHAVLTVLSFLAFLCAAGLVWPGPRP